MSHLTSYRRIRGGSWDNNVDFCTVAYRNFDYYPDSRYISFGFRLARSSGN
jgi:formylglycine-generating enzyme required for sulfatase activity